MTEQEKRRRRREMERRMRARQSMQSRGEERGGLLTFRIYVTAVLVGGCLLISLFDTATAQTVCTKLKQTIAAQTSLEQIGAWQQRAAAFLRESNISLPVFFDGTQQPAEEEEQPLYLPDTEDSP